MRVRDGVGSAVPEQGSGRVVRDALARASDPCLRTFVGLSPLLVAHLALLQLHLWRHSHQHHGAQRATRRLGCLPRLPGRVRVNGLVSGVCSHNRAFLRLCGEETCLPYATMTL